MPKYASVLKDNYERLDMAANNGSCRRADPFFTCDALLTLIKKGLKFLK